MEQLKYTADSSNEMVDKINEIVIFLNKKYNKIRCPVCKGKYLESELEWWDGFKFVCKDCVMEV